MSHTTIKSWSECECGNFYKYARIRRCESCEPMSRYHYDTMADKMAKNNIGLIYDHASIKTKFEVDIDHIVPKWYGFVAGIPYYEISRTENLQLSSSKDNFHHKSSKLPEEWFSWLTSKSWIFEHQGFKSPWLFEACAKASVPYIIAASQLIKGGKRTIEIGKKRIRVSESSSGQSDTKIHAKRILETQYELQSEVKQMQKGVEFAYEKLRMVQEKLHKFNPIVKSIFKTEIK